MIESEEANINRIDTDLLDESWEEDRLIIDLDEGKQLEPVKETVNAESSEQVAGVIIAKMPDMVISVNDKYKNSAEYKKLEQLFKAPLQQTPSNESEITAPGMPRSISRGGL